jgi:hypothetical protein
LVGVIAGANHRNKYPVALLLKKASAWHGAWESAYLKHDPVIQRQVRLYLHAHGQHVPGNKGPTATPTAAVVFALFAPVMLVQFVVDNRTSLQGHGVQDHHLLICEAVGIDPAWYQGVATGQNSLPRTTPP